MVLQFKDFDVPSLLQQVSVFGEEGLGGVQICAGLQALFRRASEWPQKFKIFVFEGDVKQAYDQLHPTLIEWALRANGVCPAFIAAILADGVNLVATATMNGIESDSFFFNKCARQGGVDSGWEWRAAMRACMGPLHEGWVKAGYGIALGAYIYIYSPDFCRQHLVVSVLF